MTSGLSHHELLMDLMCIVRERGVKDSSTPVQWEGRSCRDLRWGFCGRTNIFQGAKGSLIHILRHLTGIIEYIVVYMNLDFWGRLWITDKIWESSAHR